MIMLTIAWTLVGAGAALFAVSMLRRAESRLQTVRKSAMIVTAFATVCIIAAGTTSAWLLTSTATALLLTVLMGLAAIFMASVRERRVRQDHDPAFFSDGHLWIDVSRAVADAPTMNDMLMQAASAIRKATESDTAFVFKLARNGREVIPVGSAHRGFTTTAPSDERGDLKALARRSVADGRVAEYSHGSNVRFDESIWGLIPLRTEDTTYGTILLENPDTAISERPATQTYTAVGKLIGRAMDDWLTGAIGQSATTLVNTMSSLLSDLSGVRSFERGLPCIIRSLKGLVDADFVSLAWLDRARFHEDRVSMVINDQKILEQRRRWPVWESTTHKILERTSPLITPDLSSMADDDSSSADSTEQRLGLRSRIVVPIRVHDQNVRLVGSLTLAHRETAHYGEDEARPLEFIATLIGTWLGQLEAHRTAGEFVESAKVTSQLETDPASWRSEEEILTTILPAIGSTGLRLYRITEDGDGVRLAASAGHWRNNGSDKDDNLWPVSLSDLPWHRWALSGGVPLQINQGDPESLMGDRELNAAMTANTKTGWIVPVRNGDRTYGFLDAMEARDPDRQTIREPQRLILNAGAGAIARRWSANSIPSKPQVSDGWRKQLRTLNGTLVNPITGIIGAVELIRHKQPKLAGETIKYLNLIEHSATRIHETVLGAMDRVSEDNSEHTEDRSETIARRLFGALTRPADMNLQAATEGRSRLGTVIPRPFAMAEATAAKDAQTD